MRVQGCRFLLTIAFLTLGFFEIRGVGGRAVLCAPPLEPEAGSNLINSKLTYIFRFFTFLINRQMFLLKLVLIAYYFTVNYKIRNS